LKPAISARGSPHSASQPIANPLTLSQWSDKNSLSHWAPLIAENYATDLIEWGF
jgi:hypothetical protein